MTYFDALIALLTMLSAILNLLGSRGGNQSNFFDRLIILLDGVCKDGEKILNGLENPIQNKTQIEELAKEQTKRLKEIKRLIAKEKIHGTFLVKLDNNSYEAFSRMIHEKLRILHTPLAADKRELENARNNLNEIAEVKEEIRKVLKKV